MLKRWARAISELNLQIGNVSPWTSHAICLFLGAVLLQVLTDERHVPLKIARGHALVTLVPPAFPLVVPKTLDLRTRAIVMAIDGSQGRPVCKFEDSSLRLLQLLPEPVAELSLSGIAHLQEGLADLKNSSLQAVAAEEPPGIVPCHVHAKVSYGSL